MASYTPLSVEDDDGVGVGEFRGGVEAEQAPASHEASSALAFLSSAFFAWSIPAIRAARQPGFTVSHLPAVGVPAHRMYAELSEALGERRDWKSLARAVLWVERWRTVFTIVLALVEAALAVATPALMSMLLEAMAGPEGTLTRQTVWLCVALFVVAWFDMYLFGHVMLQLFYQGQRVNSAVQTLVFQHMLRLPAVPKGLAATLHTVDPKRISGLDSAGFEVPRMPVLIVQVAGYFYLLWRLLGPALGGTAVVMAVAMPLQYYLLRRLTKRSKDVMAVQDERANALVEILEGILTCKLFGWEEPMRQRVDEIRRREVVSIRSYNFIIAAFMMVILVSVQMFGVASFVLLAYLRGSQVLRPSVLFPALVVFDNVRWPMLRAAEILGNLAKSSISLKRVAMFLSKEPLAAQNTTSRLARGAVTLEDLSCSWPRVDWSDLRALGKDDDAEGQSEDDEVVVAASSASRGPVLKNVNVAFPAGTFAVVVGVVGAGKTALLHALLGEMRVEHGSALIGEGTTVAYCPQQPWIRSGTIRENVVFGSPVDEVDEGRYRRSLHEAGLDEDVAQLEAGDQTLVGEQGIMLSGGQKARLSLAAALYRDADLYLLDDVLSAVDAKVAAFLIREALLGLKARGKTVVLVSHQLTVTEFADVVYEVMDGTLVKTEAQAVERRRELLTSSGPQSDPDVSAAMKQALPMASSASAPMLPVGGGGGGGAAGGGAAAADQSATGNDISSDAVSWATLKFHLYHLGYGWCAVLVVFAFLHTVCGGLLNVWMAVWSSDYFHLQDYLTPYVVIGLVSTAFAVGQQLVSAVRATNASIVVHDKLLKSVIYADMRLFNHVPSGAIVSRFSSDMNVIDMEMSDAVSDCMLLSSEVVTNVLTLVLVSPISLVFVVPHAALTALVFLRLTPATSRIAQLESDLGSPVAALLQESLAGSSSIRAIPEYRSATSAMHFQRVQALTQAAMSRQGGVRFSRMAADTLSALLLLCVCGLGIIKGYSAAFVGLAASVTFGFSTTLSWGLFRMTEFGSMLAHVERIRSFLARVRVEEGLEDDRGGGQEDGWAGSAGEIEFDGVSLRYDEDGAVVLKGISFNVEAGERVGIVGRTGAGKSSIITALFRLSRFVDGRILLSGRNTAQLPLREVRAQMSVISQVPFVFSGTLRVNLDPFGQHTDEEVRRALERAHISLGPEFVVADRGHNLSQGQRQLVCLARALLRDSPILLLDEATASIDMETDQLIQRTLEQIPNKTVLTIAHRLNTIMRSNRVLVMSHGKVAEFDTPAALMANEKGMFHALVKTAGEHGMNVE